MAETFSSAKLHHWYVVSIKPNFRPTRLKTQCLVFITLPMNMEGTLENCIGFHVHHKICLGYLKAYYSSSKITNASRTHPCIQEPVRHYPSHLLSRLLHFLKHTSCEVFVFRNVLNVKNKITQKHVSKMWPFRTTSPPHPVFSNTVNPRDKHKFRDQVSQLHRTAQLLFYRAHSCCCNSPRMITACLLWVIEFGKRIWSLKKHAKMTCI